MPPTQAQELMTMQPATCTPDTPLYDVARLMVENDCGAIPVVAGPNSQKAVGIVTDRDIACRGVAKAQILQAMTAADCMTANLFTVKPNADLTDCRKLMESHHVRRLLVTDDSGNCLGIISQADIATKGSEEEALALIKQVSRPPGTPSRYAQAA